jgi:aminopeptidase-like protein
MDDLNAILNSKEIGREIHQLIAELYPICRSITGNGFRETLEIIKRRIPLQVNEVPTGTKVFDWVVPKEWNIRDAYIKSPEGERVVDFRKSNLHVVGYSLPIKAKMSLAQLKEHIITLPEHPDWVPWRTSFYKEYWGFCLSHKQFQALRDVEYEVCIDSSLEDGHLTYGEYYIPGQTSDEVLISCHACHPSLCNDNLAGVAVSSILAKRLSAMSLRYSYRFLFMPVTIGAITWLSRNEAHLSKIKHGLVASCLGDSGKSTYKKTRRGDQEIDMAAIHVMRHSGQDYQILEFSPYGYDERQFCSPAFNLPVGCLMRTPHGQFPEYHTSADDLTFVQPAFLADSFSKMLSMLYILDNNRTYLNLSPKCEPQLGRRGLYPLMGGQARAGLEELAVLWVLNLSDGTNSLLQIAERSGTVFESIKKAADALLIHNLLTEN